MMEHLPTRAGLSLLGGVAAYMAVSFDPPKSNRETAFRIGVGSASCFFFAPVIVSQYAAFQTPDGWIPVFGIVGLISWYAMGTLGKGLMWLQKSNLAEDLARARLGIPKPPGKPADKPEGGEK
jgi:hypothetical protein